MEGCVCDKIELCIHACSNPPSLTSDIYVSPVTPFPRLTPPSSVTGQELQDNIISPLGALLITQ